MNQAIVDTNTIVGFLVRGETLFEKSLKIYEGLILPVQVVFEAIYVLQKQYGIDRLSIVKEFTALLQRDGIKTERIVLLDTLFKFRDLPQLSLVDCYLLTLAQESNIEIVTSDKKLKKKL